MLKRPQPGKTTASQFRAAVLALALLLPAGLACSERAQHPNAGTGAGGAGPVLDPGRKEMHLLNSAEYNATVQDVLGTALGPASSGWRGGQADDFDNIASVLRIDEAQYSRYLSAAEALATDALGTEQLRARLVTCQLTDPACAQRSIAALGRRLFRRPLAASELQTYQRVYDSARASGDSEVASLTLTLQALLSSAEFLYRIELDPSPESKTPHLLSPYELASRVSYFLWSSAPDEALLQSAADGSIMQPATLAATVDRLLDDPDKSTNRFVANFAGQWLGARQVPANPAIAEVFGATVALAASKEMLKFFEDFLRTEKSWFQFPTEDFNWVNGELPHLYGMPSDLDGMDTWERVTYYNDKRAGFFGLAGFLALTSLETRTSPSLRGKWILSHLLCKEPPPPPPGLRPLTDNSNGGGADAGTDADGGVRPVLNVRHVLEQHRANPTCASCHARFDPYGLALEQFDATGAYRSTYDDGSPIDTRAMLPDGQTVRGLDDLSQAVAADPHFGACLAQKLFTYGMGRLVTSSDLPYLQEAQQKWLAPGQIPSLRRMIQALIASDAFRSRRGGS